MKRLFCFTLLLALSGLAFGQVNLPPCDPNHVVPNCTDYFGSGNWANSPLPAGSITGFTIVAPGSGYANAIAVISSPDLSTGTQAIAGTVNLTAGAVTAIAAPGANSGYILPQVTIVDVGPSPGTLAVPTCGAPPLTACGSGALVTALIGPPYIGGIRKFQPGDTLPDLKGTLATADTTTFPGSDYYEIALVQNTWKFHTDLPPTTLRGYVQLPSGSVGCPAAPAINYLGPTIVATKNRPVRVKFTNCLPTGAGGNLFIPTDTTYMGAGMTKIPGVNYTQNRATLHLHGGATPWISDGTPHQWTVPVGETGGPARGDSVQMVPDMWFDATGKVIAACAGRSTCAVAGATNDPGIGALPFYWTNQQGARLMFYHDHALGITRLNVYAGEAAGYLLSDPVEEAALAAAKVPGTITDLPHLIPLVIQDKSFVPSQAQLAVQDPTWAGHFGTTPLSTTGGNGDLWFPHVYVPNQNPSDPGGANAFGRWDYGPWFTPAAQTLLSAANPAGAITTSCTSSAFPNAVVNCPITPNPSGTPEGFMDTPMVNGKAYPVLHVAPEAYRFKILSAGNDRSLNLQLYVADPTVANGVANTEVKMLPAAAPSTGTPPLCTQLTPITNTALVTGLAAALLDSSGNPINGTGLPAGCWPNYGAAAGIPIQQTMWPSDGRFGGVPDPTTAGPPFIQIGTEGGLLPSPVVIPSTPTNYEYNPRSVTITNVGVHGLWLGTAERADAIVDFSKFGGKTLILYNDAPTPAPAVDSRTDYFTGDGDQTPIGGAPNTPAGYGPNTRTIMQIVVDQPTSGQPAFSLPALTAALPGIFGQTQPQIVIPEPAYPPATGGYSPTWNYDVLHSASFTYYPIGSITSVTLPEQRKAIQELFTHDYGRMNATLGVELPLTNFLTQTTIPLGYIDPPTEIISQGETQLWKITHNGVDTHFIHFHLFNVQVINRMGWDGTVRPIEANELGWKDTVRMNPLEDILVALQPITPVVPFPLRDSYRLTDVTQPTGSDCPALGAASASPLPCSDFTNINPLTNNPAQTPNAINNFGWEYVWHCHILGHEENDMMRAISFQVPPEAPSNLVVAAATAPATGLKLTWIDNSASETGFSLQRATDAAFTLNVNTFTVAPLSPDANGQGTTFGGTLTYNDAGATGPAYFYRVRAFKPDASYWTPTGTNITSAWSTIASSGGPVATVSPVALAFGNVPLYTTSAPQTVTISNTGTQPLTFTSVVFSAPVFTTPTNMCPNPLPANSNCTLTVAFTPTASGPLTGTLTIGTNDPAHPTLTVSLAGAGGLPVLTITANNTTMKYGAAVPPLTVSYSPLNPVGTTTPPTCTTTATSTNATPVGNYPITCSGAANANYTIVYVPGTVSVTQVPLTIFAKVFNMPYGGLMPPITPPSYVGLVAGDVAPKSPPACTTTATITNTTPPGTYPSTCSGAVDANYITSYVNGNITIVRGALTVTTGNTTRLYGAANPAVVPTTTGLATGDTLAALGITCSSAAVANSPVSPPTYVNSCAGPASTANYATITYANTGALTITVAPLTITAPSPSMTYGGPIPALTPTFTGFVGGDTPASLTTQPSCATTATVASPVGTYPVTCSGAVDTNYAITYVAGTMTVTPKAASVTPTAATKVYGAVDPALTGNLSGFLAPDLVTATYSRTAGETVAGSPYTISAVLAPAGVLGNYTITYNTAPFTITKAALTITANAATRAYGAANPAFSATYAGFVNGDTVASLTGTLTCTSPAVANSPVSGNPYAINCAGQSSPNYTITYVSGQLTITVVPLTINPPNATMTYGGPLPTFTPTYVGLAAGDTAPTTKPTCLTTATATSPVASYPVTCSGAASTNYSPISYGPNGALTVTAKAASVAPNAATKVYGTADPTLTGTLSGFLTSDGVTATYTRTAGETVAGSPYTISAVLAPAGVLTNYTITYNTAAFTITKATTVTTITSHLPSPSTLQQPVAVAFTVAPGTATGNVTVTASGGGSCTASVNHGTCNITFTTAGTRTLTAVYAGDTNFLTSTSAGVSQTVNAPTVTLNPTSWNFGNWKAGTTSTSHAFTITNTGSGALINFTQSLTGANPSNFSIVANTCGATLLPGANCVVNVTFTPTVKGNNYAANLTLIDNALNSPQNVALSGKGN